MVIGMLKKSCFLVPSALLLAASLSAAKAEPLGPGMLLRHSPVISQDATLLRIRDTRTSAAGGGGGGSDNTCWSSCFRNYNGCMETGPKNMCVTRVKSCLELCDRLSNKPRM
jgi:hypothetical protein